MNAGSIRCGDAEQLAEPAALGGVGDHAIAAMIDNRFNTRLEGHEMTERNTASVTNDSTITAAMNSGSRSEMYRSGRRWPR